MKVWTLLFLICMLQSPGVRGRCLTPSGVLHRRFYNYNGLTKALLIDSSDGVTHNITSNIIKIYLEEELGYGDVTIVISNDRSFEKSLTRVSEIGGFPPDTMINTEVWLHPKDVVNWSVNAWNLGLTISVGRFGWFSSKKDLCWKDFQAINPPQFNLPDKIEEKALKWAATNYINSEDLRLFPNGTYIPPHCEVIGVKCATLLSGDFGSANRTVEDIKEFKLYVKVIWLGRDLIRVMDLLPNNSYPLLALTSYPNEVSIRRKQWYPVAFPPCTNYSAKTMGPGCLYESRKVIKLVSGRVRIGAPLAFQAVSRAMFSRQDYDYLLNSTVYNTSLTHEDIACNWLKRNPVRWKRWIIEGTQKPKLSICGILPLNGTMEDTGLGIVPAVVMAVKRINAKQVLPHHELTITAHDGGCTSDLVMNTFINYVLESNAKDLVGIVGPACSETVEPLIKLTKYFRTVVISYSAEGSSFTDRDQYPYFFRTIGANRRYKDVYFELFQKLGWKRMVALTEEGPKYAEYLSELESIQSNKFKLIYQKKLPRERNNATIRTKLDGFKIDNARIIVADVHDSSARAVMCEAFKQHMTAADGYVWFLPQWLSNNWYLTSGRHPTENNDCNDADMYEAIKGHFSLAHRYFAPDTEVTHENETVANWKAAYRVALNHTAESNYAGFAYDAVWTYAYALQKLTYANESYLSDIHSLSATSTFVNLINETDFMGVSGRITFNRSEPSRPTIINILQWNHSAKTYNEVGYMDEEPIIYTALNSAQLHLREDAIVWYTVDGKKPTDGGELSNCAVKGLADLLDVDCSSAIIIANVIGFGLLAVVLMIVIAFTKTKYDKKIKKYQKSHDYMRSIGFEKCPTDNLLEMEKWETPRDCVVINRRLGEGSFGVVYGGELLLGEKGWVPAAIKTLKSTSDSERKMEFLGEAEMMKKFDHKNIVKLLGVCTTDPLYTIMEFMLYGDLKTYLLNRRHLVTGRRFLEENNEVSSKRLTNIALGIARGLSYLTSIKYVHRDLAARNCLLNSNRIVKIGDFGMARPMYDSDYYKFSRKGMLPVRWMARESMIDGIFTPQSDMWSMGVVLYEIITFGSYPFPGLTNAQVVDHVKAGNVVQLPKGLKTPLECLIKACWKPDPKKRPAAREMVEFLANNPRVISPCLDQPASSIAVDDSDGLGLELGIRRSAPVSPRELGLNLFHGDGLIEDDDDIDSRFQQLGSLSLDSIRESALARSSGVNIPMSPISSRSVSEENLEIQDDSVI